MAKNTALLGVFKLFPPNKTTKINKTERCIGNLDSGKDIRNSSFRF